MISMTPRKHIPLSLTLLTPAVAIFLTLAVGATIFGLLGFSPFGSLYTFFVAPISRPDQIGDLFVKACPSNHYRHRTCILFSGECVEYRR